MPPTRPTSSTMTKQIVGERLARAEAQIDHTKEAIKEFRDHAASVDSRLHTLEKAYERLLGTWRGMSVVVGIVSGLTAFGVNIAFKFFG